MENEKTMKIIKLNTDIVTVTGLHIGAGREHIEIGGLDLPVIKNPKTGFPYIPGSTIKGKLRFLTEWANNLVGNGDPCECGKIDCPVCRIFGSKKNPGEKEEKRGPTRLIVRDSEIKSDFNLEKDLEIKWENTIDRTTGTAKNPRPRERVVPGTVFGFELVYRIFEINKNGGLDDIKFFCHVIDALKRDRKSVV